MNDDIGAELKTAILNLHEAMTFGFERSDRQIADLRHDMNRRFDRLLDDVDGRFAKVDARFDRLLDDVHGRFAKVDARFDRMDERFDRMDERFDGMDGRFDRLEDRVAAIEPRGHRPAS